MRDIFQGFFALILLVLFSFGGLIAILAVTLGPAFIVMFGLYEIAKLVIQP